MPVERSAPASAQPGAASLWHRPDILNAIASTLFTAAFLLAAYGAVHYVVRLPAFPLREVRVNARLEHVTREQIETIVRREFAGNFFTLDLAAARAAFEKLPWVRSVAVRRHWPDRLEVALEEHVPLARWGGTALVSAHGEVFVAAYDGNLPMFMGPEGSAREIAQQYVNFRRTLGVIGRTPVQVHVSLRRAWRIRLDNGLVIELGRERIESRLDRFVAVYDRTVGALQRKLDYADLRYSHGFAVRIPELKSEPQEPRRRGGANTKRG